MTQIQLSKRFIALMACLMGLTAVGIDAVLPIFPEMTQYYKLPADGHNQIQNVIFMYMLGFSMFQLVFGILADTLGRKPLLLIGIGIYTIAATSVIFIDSFENVLIARFIQGAGLAAPRVLSVTIIRDISSGKAMSQVMSLVVMIFLAVPAIAPFIGQLVVFFAPWQSVFMLLAALGLILFVWSAMGLHETMAPEDRRAFSIKPVSMAMKEFLSNRETQRYLALISLLFGTLMMYIGLSEQILQQDVYQLNELFPLAFGAVVIGMIASAMTNARTVMRLGMRKLLRNGMTLIVIADSILLISVISGDESIPLWAFIALLLVHFFGFGLCMPNLNALALEPYHHIAGTASALIGTITSITGVVIAQSCGYFYDGSLYTLTIGFCICTALALLCMANLTPRR